jgi:3-hydroxyacyl-[acyl-carrier-protein] dehydratase
MQLNSNEIQKVIPHRYPFQMVDRIVDGEGGKWAEGIKCVSANEMHFMGHFPEEHVMPGVLILEAMAQVGGIAVSFTEEGTSSGRIGYFTGVNSARFKGMVKPGDVLRIRTEITKKKGPVFVAEATAKVEDKLVCKAEIMFAIGQ